MIPIFLGMTVTVIEPGLFSLVLIRCHIFFPENNLIELANESAQQHCFKIQNHFEVTETCHDLWTAAVCHTVFSESIIFCYKTSMDKGNFF